MLSLSGLGYSQPAGAQGDCSPGFERRTLEWSTDTNPDNGAVWGAGANKFSMGDGLLATATLVDAGAVDAPSTLANSELLAQASPGSDGSLVWNIDTTNAENPPHSTLLFEFSKPVQSFSIVVIDIDAKGPEESSIGWHDQVTGFVNGEQTTASLQAADPTVVTVEGMTAWAAAGRGKTPNESPAGNVTFSATGTVVSAGLTYSDGPRSTASPERHAIGLSSVSVCASGTSSDAPTDTTVAEPDSSTPTLAEPSIADDAPTSAVPTSQENLAAKPASTKESPATATPSTVERPNEALSIVTTASDPEEADDGTYRYHYTITATNNDSAPLDSVELFHDLDDDLSAASSWAVNDASTTTGPCTTSSEYDGKSHVGLLSDKTVLTPNQSCQIEVAMTLRPTENGQRFTASATGSSEGSGLVSSEGVQVTLSDGTNQLAHTGVEAEDFAAAGALLFILGAVVIGYDDRFIRPAQAIN